MNILFATKKLKKCAGNQKVAIKEWGSSRTEIFFRRITALYAAESFDDLRNLPGHFHELTENRKGQWSCDLDQPYRLIIKPDIDKIPVDKDGKFVWSAIDCAVLVEIINYHKER